MGANNTGSSVFQQKSCFRDPKLISLLSSLPQITVLNLDPAEALPMPKPYSAEIPGIHKGLHLNSIPFLISPLLSVGNQLEFI